MAEIRSVAFLGAGGTMGLPMAGNLLRAGFDIRAWNRSREKAEPLAEDGAQVVDTAANAVEDADAVVTMLPDADAVAEVAGRAVLDRTSEDAVWIQMSTVGIEGTERLSAIAGESSVTFVDAPVLGTKQPAENAELVILASGPDEARDRVAPVFDALGKKTMWVGEAGSGSRLKVVTNAWLVALVEGAAESIALAEGIGIDPKLFLEAIGGGPLDTPYLEMKANMMIERVFEPSFRLALAAKDTRLATEAASRHELDLPLLEAISRRFEEGADRHGDEDLAATFLTSVER
jgi:3-hydroxyisobutyrate dehydrogenase